MNDNSEYGADTLSELRGVIDEIDNELMHLLSRRFEVCDRIGEFKRVQGISIENISREAEIFRAVDASKNPYTESIKAVFSSTIRESKALQRQKQNLYLIGMPASGKSRYAKQLSLMLNMPYADTDAMVMDSSKMNIDEIFDSLGETAFREMEHNELIKIAKRGGTVVATGGGILTNPKNIDILHSSGKLVFLNRPLEGLMKARVHNRPLIRKGQEAIRRLYNERLETYTQNANYITNPDSPGAASRIVRFFIRVTR